MLRGGSATLRPTFLARQRQRRRAEFVKQQKMNHVLQQNKLAVELEAIAKNVRTEIHCGIQNTLWDLLESLDDARQTGETGPLLVVLTNFIGAASGHRQEPLLSLSY